MLVLDPTLFIHYLCQTGEIVAVIRVTGPCEVAAWHLDLHCRVHQKWGDEETAFKNGTIPIRDRAGRYVKADKGFPRPRTDKSDVKSKD
jgi:hypothetical protein